MENKRLIRKVNTYRKTMRLDLTDWELINRTDLEKNMIESATNELHEQLQTSYATFIFTERKVLSMFGDKEIELTLTITLYIEELTR